MSDTANALAPEKSQYGTARTVAVFISFLGWVGFVIGVLAAIISVVSVLPYRAISILEILPGLGMAVSGLFLVAAGQVTRATVDNSDQTREILKVLRKQP